MEVYIISYGKEDIPLNLFSDKSVIIFFFRKFSFLVIIYRSCQLNFKKILFRQRFVFNWIELEERKDILNKDIFFNKNLKKYIFILI